MAEGGDIEMNVFNRGEREDIQEDDDFDTSRIIVDDGIDTGLYEEQGDIGKYGEHLGTRLVPASDELTRRLNLELKKDKLNAFYDYIKRETGYEPGIIDSNNFIRDTKDQLYVKKGNSTVVRLTKRTNSGQFKFKHD